MKAQEQFLEAELIMKRGLTIDPESKELYNCLGAQAYLELAGWDEAITEYQRILKINDNYPLAHYYLAQAYQGKGDQQRAKAEYQRFLQVWSQADTDLPEINNAKQFLLHYS